MQTTGLLLKRGEHAFACSHMGVEGRERCCRFGEQVPLTLDGQQEADMKNQGLLRILALTVQAHSS